MCTKKKHGKPYIERVLETLYFFSKRQNTVTKEELGQYITPKIRNEQLSSAISNYKRINFDLLRDDGYSKWLLNKEKIESLYQKYLSNENITLWNQGIKGRKITPIKQGTRSTARVLCAVFAAYNKGFSIKELSDLANKHGYKLSPTTIHYATDRAKRPCAKRLGKNRRESIYGPDVSLIMDYGIDILLDILPDKKHEIEVFFQSQKAIKKDIKEQVPAPPEIKTQVEVENDQSDKTTDKTAPADNEAQEIALETVDAANVGGAIIAYIRKLQQDKKQASGPELEKLESVKEQQGQTIINLRNEIIGLEGQVSKLQRMIDSQSNKIVDLTNELEKKKNEYKKLFEASRVPVPTTFKLNEVARMTKLIKR